MGTFHTKLQTFQKHTQKHQFSHVFDNFSSKNTKENKKNKRKQQKTIEFIEIHRIHTQKLGRVYTYSKLGRVYTQFYTLCSWDAYIHPPLHYTPQYTP